MRILVIGSGGREHALSWKISRSSRVSKLWIAPGNPGTGQVGENVPLASGNQFGITAFARENRADLVVIGPEAPLAAGLGDRLGEAGIPVFGPGARAAELEGSKAFCKELLVRHRVPTASFRVFRELNPALSYLEGGLRFPLVVKASGLAAGKGVVICENAAQARKAVKGMLEEGLHGEAGRTVVLEEFLEGPEASAFALTDGRTMIPLEICQDYKTLQENDQGPNTGGMGSLCPNPQVGDRVRDAIEREVLLPTLHAMNREGRRFQGVLFAGLKLTPAGPKVLEFNVRFGDPETQTLMLRMRSDIVPLLLACAKGNLEECQAPEWDPRPAVCVVLASPGYPRRSVKGLEITGLEDLEGREDLQVFHAGTALEDGRLVTAGGRVLGVSALGDDVAQARTRAYEAAQAIRFEGRQIRGDIALRTTKALGAAR
ncbi:MAG: phosphoribosylamine--glycine ligase [Planctomycetota bacterium]